MSTITLLMCQLSSRDSHSKLFWTVIKPHFCLCDHKCEELRVVVFVTGIAVCCCLLCPGCCPSVNRGCHSCQGPTAPPITCTEDLEPPTGGDKCWCGRGEPSQPRQARRTTVGCDITMARNPCIARGVHHVLRLFSAFRGRKVGRGGEATDNSPNLW